MMRVAEAAFEVERAALARGTVEQISLNLADPTAVMASVFFVADEEPLTLLIDLPAPISAATFDEVRDALASALLPSPSPSVH